jgi:hypothetical protein
MRAFNTGSAVFFRIAPLFEVFSIDFDISFPSIDVG